MHPRGVQRPDGAGHVHVALGGGVLGAGVGDAGRGQRVDARGGSGGARAEAVALFSG